MSLKVTFEELLKGQKSLELVKGHNLEDLKQLLKNAQSKKCRAKAMNRLEDLHKTEKIIEVIQNEISILRPTKTIDASNMSLEEINKAIRNAQSKKCLALAMSKDAKQFEDEEDYFKKMKETMKPESTLNKIDKMIEELRAMKQTKEIAAQIQILERLR